MPTCLPEQKVLTRAILLSSSFAPRGISSPIIDDTTAWTTCMRTPPPTISTAATGCGPDNPAAANTSVIRLRRRCSTPSQTEESSALVSWKLTSPLSVRFSTVIDDSLTCDRSFLIFSHPIKRRLPALLPGRISALDFSAHIAAKWSKSLKSKCTAPRSLAERLALLTGAPSVTSTTIAVVCVWPISNKRTSWNMQ